MMYRCLKCGKTLEKDEIALCKKLINRDATEFMCIDCLSEYFRVEKTLLYEKIDFFKKMGCTLFQ